MEVLVAAAAAAILVEVFMAEPVGILDVCCIMLRLSSITPTCT